MTTQTHRMQKNVLSLFFKLIFLGINALFLLKYGIRQNHIPVYLLISLYVLFAAVLLFKNPFELPFLKHKKLQSYFLGSCFTVFVIILTVTILTDGNTLKVDRWSAMDVALRALLNGEYPYTATDHLNGRTSNFPGLLLLGLPFYIMGNVGYLQAASFLLLSYTLYRTLNIKTAFHFLLLLLFCPAYWWEIFSISDLFSNMILILCFVLLLRDKLKDQIFKYPVLLGISTSILVMTRGIVAIPLTLLVFKDFWTIKLSEKLKYVTSFTITLMLLIAMVLANCPDWSTLKSYNPLVLQTSTLPGYISLLAILLPFYFSFQIKDFETDFFRINILLLLFPISTAFILKFYSIGYDRMLVGGNFDLSYLSIVIPFIIYEIVTAHPKFELNQTANNFG